MVGHSVDLKRSRQGLRGLMHVADAQALVSGTENHSSAARSRDVADAASAIAVCIHAYK